MARVMLLISDEEIAMPKPFKEWTVLPHGTLTRVEENILSVTGTLHMPLGEVNRRMTVVRLRGGELIIHSAIALDEAEMRTLEAFGTPTYLIVPNNRHRMDARIWKDRYPHLRVIAPAGAREKVEEIVPVDFTEITFGDPNVELFTVPGTKQNDVALLVQTPSGHTLILNEVIFNLPDEPGLHGFLFKLLGVSGEPKVTKVVRLVDLDDEKALHDQLERWAKVPRLNRIIVSHGDIIEKDAPEILHKIAATLATDASAQN